MIPDIVRPDDDPRKTYASDEACAQLAKLCGDARTRIVGTRPVHVKWRPTAVRDPATTEAFRPDDAWTFIANAILGGEPVEVVPLETQPGKNGYVLKPRGWEGEIIYVKLQFGPKRVIGQSFHSSDRQPVRRNAQEE